MNPHRLTLLLLAFIPASTLAAPPPAASDAFTAYSQTVESRLARQHLAPATFLAATPHLDPGRILIEDLIPTPNPAPGGTLLHHWRATTFARGANAAQLTRLLRDLPAYPRIYAPQVLSATLLTPPGDDLLATLRVRQHHLLTVTLDTSYAIAFAALDPAHASSASRSTRIAEVPATEDHGFLWRQNTYWSWAQRDGGLALQVESVSLTRAIPRGLAWAVEPFVESIPRESLEFTLRATCAALRP